jgi:hypothetical protein
VSGSPTSIGPERWSARAGATFGRLLMETYVAARD